MLRSRAASLYGFPALEEVAEGKIKYAYKK
jgi:hypothetical protein